MTTEYKPAIAKLYKDLEKASARVTDIKKAINMLSVLSNESEPFKDISAPSITGKMNFRSDQFFGKPFATAAKEYLKVKGQAVTAEEIMRGLERGGFEFQWKSKLRLRNTAISLGKNSDKFVYVKTSNAYGLWEFYPDKKKEKEKKQEPTAELNDRKQNESTKNIIR